VYYAEIGFLAGWGAILYLVVFLLVVWAICEITGFP
jgi:hypothetical protein